MVMKLAPITRNTCRMAIRHVRRKTIKVACPLPRYLSIIVEVNINIPGIADGPRIIDFGLRSYDRDLGYAYYVQTGIDEEKAEAFWAQVIY